MITLTTPIYTLTLGDGTVAAYNQAEVVAVHHNTRAGAKWTWYDLEFTASANPNAPVIKRRGFANVPPEATGKNRYLHPSNADFEVFKTLTAGQITAVEGWSDDAKSSVENGLNSVGVFVGTVT